MLRAVRFAARLGFAIDPATYEAIHTHAALIQLASPPRLLEEVVRLFAFQSGEAAFRLLHQTGLLSFLFPGIEAYLNESGGEASPLWSLLRGLDARERPAVQPDQELVFGALLYGPFAQRVQAAQTAGRYPAHAEIARDVLHPMSNLFRMSKRVFYGVIRLLDVQRRFEFGQGKQRFPRERFAAQDIFPWALALYEVRVKAGMGDPGVLPGWQELLRQSSHPRRRLRPNAEVPAEQARPPAGRDHGGPPDRWEGGRRRRRRPRNRRGQGDGALPAAPMDKGNEHAAEAI